MYKGVAYLHQDRIESVLRTAEVLQVSLDPVTRNLNSLFLPLTSWHPEPTLTLTTCRQQNWILAERWTLICIRPRDKIQFDPTQKVSPSSEKCVRVLFVPSSSSACWLTACNPNQFRAGLLVKVTPLQSQSRVQHYLLLSENFMIIDSLVSRTLHFTRPCLALPLSTRPWLQSIIKLFLMNPQFTVWLISRWRVSLTAEWMGSTATVGTVAPGPAPAPGPRPPRLSRPG